MIAQSPKLKEIAKAQWTNEVKISAKRGNIVDRNGVELAVSANVYRIDLDMNTLRETLKDKKLTNDDIAPKIASAIDMDVNEIKKILNKTLPSGLPLASASVKRRVDKEQADKIKDLKINGILVSADTKRYYPNNNFLAHVLGHTNSDGEGLTGVELQYNKQLSGIPGVKISETDRKSKDLPDAISEYTKPIEGSNVVLTIDEMIQHFCEKAAQQALSDNKAKAVTIIAMDPRNGEILAMVNKPDYNPNNPWEGNLTSDEIQKKWRNRAVSDTFEPGSIFKVITSTAALSENKVSDTDKFVCNGSIQIAGRTIHCWKTSGHGVQTFVDILKNSCNIGFAEVGRRLGAELLYKYINKFGFGQKTGIDLPGEARGIVKKVQDVSELDVATISFGQVNTVSCVQYLSAFNAVANGGKLIKPHVMKEISHFDEESSKTIVDMKYSNKDEKQIIDPNVAAKLRGYLEKVISEGGGSKAFIDGYHIAGKTGTAQKAGPGGYQNQKYIASFAGMAPADNPQISLFISIDEPDPSNYYAGQIAAPVAKGVFNDIFNYLAFKTDSSKEDVENSLKKDVTIPEVRGLKKSEAIIILKKAGLGYDMDSNGEYITDINPKPGYSIKEGTKIVLYTGTSNNYNKIVVVPNLTGMNSKGAKELLESIGLKAELIGDGWVNEQSIEPGKETNKGTTIRVQLDQFGD